MHYRTDVNSVDYMSITGRSLPDLTVIVRPMTHSLAAALSHQSPHCAATEVCVGVFVRPAHKMSAYLAEHHHAAPWQIL